MVPAHQRRARATLLDMIDPFEMPIDSPTLVDMPHGQIQVTRGTDHVWVFAKPRDGAWWRVGTARHTPGDEYEWELVPVAPLFDEDGYDGWRAVMHAADVLPLTEI